MSYAKDVLDGLEKDEDAGSSLLAKVLCAIHDQHASPSLSDILHTLEKSTLTTLLDPLEVLPPLLRCADPAAYRLVQIIGEQSSAKEVVIAVQEAVELLETQAASESDESQPLPFAKQISSLIGLYSSAIPRLHLRKKTALQTITPLLTDLRRTILSLSENFIPADCRDVLSAFIKLTHVLVGWINGLDISNEESAKCKDFLEVTLDALVEAFCDHIQSSLAQRTFEAKFPRLVVRSAVHPDWKQGDEIALHLRQIYGLLGMTANVIPEPPSIPWLIVWAHSDSEDQTTSQLSRVIPLILSCIQGNVALDETLAVLLTTVSATPAVSELPLELVVPLCTTLPPLASIHPDPPTRHLVFKLLSLILQRSPQQMRLQVLRDLTSQESPPQMRVAALGLVREAIMEGLASPPSLFASPEVIRQLGKTIFSLDPPDVLVRATSEELRESQEPARLVECLTLYYLLLFRDENNMTGVRDRSMVVDVDRSLLSPIRDAIRQSGYNEHATDGSHNMSMISLEIGLQRVETALETLNLKISSDQ